MGLYALLLLPMLLQPRRSGLPLLLQLPAGLLTESNPGC
jgi:hypothetical protein